LVKLYADEADCEVIRAINVIVVSRVARVEVPAAIRKKQRMGELDEEQARALIAEFEADYFGTVNAAPRFVVVDVTSAIFERAAALVATHPLRAYDAIQLASACIVQEVDPACKSFACADATLRAAAAAEGFTLVP
jgi:predicted nucleic acid-binding protein